MMASLLALVSVVLGGICNDNRNDCANWARGGECTGENAEYMALTCPLSCGICTHSCSDTDVSCADWAKNGECESNPDTMLRICPTSCGLCTPECKDLSDECPAWGSIGECNENPEFMAHNCPVTCRTCKPVCRDLENDCPGWTAEGMCNTNPGYTLKTCSLSCGVCAGNGNNTAVQANIADGGSWLKMGRKKVETMQEKALEDLKCADNNATQCKIWEAAGECLKNPMSVMKQCPDTCGLCRTVCMDHDDSCKGWKEAGQCEENQGFMYHICPSSCGICSKLEAPPVKEEL